jgi:hypothetical protein
LMMQLTSCMHPLCRSAIPCHAVFLHKYNMLRRVTGRAITLLRGPGRAISRSDLTDDSVFDQSDL